MAIENEFPPSWPCSCDTCVSYCRRPGWWTVREAEMAVAAGYAGRMMLEIAPELNFAVLSPAFRGNEGNYALELYAAEGCTFLVNNLCELFGTGLQPLECRYCHHEREGMGENCHQAIEAEWNTDDAKRLIVRWGNLTGFWLKQGMEVHEK
ncbi:MAG TPA: hypothetical protein PLJ84_12085, partial [Bacteroidales bacterium]|nr:hypothetical protein [Bacteroidales bacterium]HPT03328.1 hypothetical protein [Bacteroidales bacterium]